MNIYIGVYVGGKCDSVNKWWIKVKGEELCIVILFQLFAGLKIFERSWLEKKKNLPFIHIYL